MRKVFIKTCRDFPNLFSKIIPKESQGFLEVRVLFDSYYELSSKSKTRGNCTSGI